MLGKLTKCMREAHRPISWRCSLISSSNSGTLAAERRRRVFSFPVQSQTGERSKWRNDMLRLLRVWREFKCMQIYSLPTKHIAGLRIRLQWACHDVSETKVAKRSGICNWHLDCTCADPSLCLHLQDFMQHKTCALTYSQCILYTVYLSSVYLSSVYSIQIEMQRDLRVWTHLLHETGIMISHMLHHETCIPEHLGSRVVFLPTLPFLFCCYPLFTTWEVQSHMRVTWNW